MPYFLNFSFICPYFKPTSNDTHLHVRISYQITRIIYNIYSITKNRSCVTPFEMTQVQPAMIIAGIPEDQVFSHICYMANHLSQMLPNFQFKKICKQREEWEVRMAKSRSYISYKQIHKLRIQFQKVSKLTTTHYYSSRLALVEKALRYA